MFNLYIYGASDDLIEIDGDWREEFYASLNDKTFIVFNDGTIYQANYDGEWKFNFVKGGSLWIGSAIHFIPYGGNCDRMCCENGIISGVPDYSEVVWLSFRDKP